MRSKSVLSTEVRARDCAVRTAIGRILSAQYDLAEPLPDRLQTLLRRLEDGALNRIQRRQSPLPPL
jgi:hypothetical protein